MQELEQVPQHLITELQKVFYPGPHIIENTLEVIRTFMDGLIKDVELYDHIMLADYMETLEGNWLEELILNNDFDSVEDEKSLTRPIKTGNADDDQKKAAEFAKKRVAYFSKKIGAINSDFQVIELARKESGRGPIGAFCQGCLTHCENSFLKHYQSFQTIAPNRKLAIILKSIIAGLHTISKFKNDIVDSIFQHQERIDLEQREKSVNPASPGGTPKEGSGIEGGVPSTGSISLSLRSLPRDSPRGDGSPSLAPAPSSPQRGSAILLRPQFLRIASNSALSVPRTTSGEPAALEIPTARKNTYTHAAFERVSSNSSLKATSNSGELTVALDSSPARKHTSATVERTLSNSSLRAGSSIRGGLPTTPRGVRILKGQMQLDSHGTPRGSIVGLPPEVSGNAMVRLISCLAAIRNSKFFLITEEESNEKDAQEANDGKINNGLLSRIFTKKSNDGERIKDNEIELPIDFWDGTENFCVTLDRLIVNMSQMKSANIGDEPKTQLITSLIVLLTELKTWIAGKSIIVLYVYNELELPSKKSEVTRPPNQTVAAQKTPILPSNSLPAPPLSVSDSRSLTPNPVPATASSSLPNRKSRDSKRGVSSSGEEVTTQMGVALIGTTPAPASVSVQVGERKTGSKIYSASSNSSTGNQTADPAPPKSGSKILPPSVAAPKEPRPKNGSKIGTNTATVPASTLPTDAKAKKEEGKNDDGKTDKQKSGDGSFGFLGGIMHIFTGKEQKKQHNRGQSVSGKMPPPPGPAPATSSDSTLFRTSTTKPPGRASSFGSSNELDKNNYGNDSDGIFSMDATAKPAAKPPADQRP